jgi:hypothetical protein
VSTTEAGWHLRVRVALISLGAAIGFVYGVLIGLVYGWFHVHGTHGPGEPGVLLRACSAGATSGTILGAALGVLTGRDGPGRPGKN